MPQQPRFGAVHFQGALMCCEDHDREPCPHDPARRCEGCPGGSTAATVAQAAPAPVAEPSTPFADTRAQIVYGLLADSEAMPPDGQHWEGWVARRIVDALAAAPAAAQPVAKHPTLLQCVREMLEFQSAKEGPSIHDWGRWRRAADAADATPPALVGLSDEQIMHLWFAAEPTPDGRPASWNYAQSVMRALAAANGMTLREGGNG